MHEIDGRNAYSYLSPMWHRLGTVGNVPMTAKAIMKEHFDIFPVLLRPAMVDLNVQVGETLDPETGAYIPHYEQRQVESGFYAIVRGATPARPEEIVFDTCTERYHPLQPIEVAETFDESVKQYVETLAFLREGREMFISWKLPGFEVKPNDMLELYGIVRTGFDTKTGARLFTSVYRPVCANTINLAENWATSNTNKKRNQGAIWRGKGVNRNLLRDLGYWLEHVQANALMQRDTVREFFTKIADTPVTVEDAKALVWMAFPDKDDVSSRYPSKLQSKKQEAIMAYNEAQGRTRDGIVALFEGAGTAITPDAYGLLNATSEWLCHYMKSKKEIAESVMFGARQQSSMQMIEVLREFALYS